MTLGLEGMKFVWPLEFVPHLLKDRISQPEGGEWEIIKISQQNLVYVPNLIKHVSFLTQLRPRSYKKATDPHKWVR
jgi:hypothetical protein